MVTIATLLALSSTDIDRPLWAIQVSYDAWTKPVVTKDDLKSQKQVEAVESTSCFPNLLHVVKRCVIKCNRMRKQLQKKMLQLKDRRNSEMRNLKQD